MCSCRGQASVQFPSGSLHLPQTISLPAPLPPPTSLPTMTSVARSETKAQGAHTHTHSQCLESQVLRVAARAPRRMRVYPMGCARTMSMRKPETQRLMDKILHHRGAPPFNPEVVWRTAPHHTPPLLPHWSMLERAASAPVQWCKIFPFEGGFYGGRHPPNIKM